MLIKIRILFTILYGFTVVKSFIKLILHSKQSLSTIQNRQYNAIKYHVYGKKFLLVPCFSLHAKPLDFSSTGRPNRRASPSQNEIVSEESTNSVEDETMVSEVELKAVWKRSGRPMLSFNVQQALILLMNEDDDEDKDSITALKKNGQVLSSLQLTNSTDKKTTSKIPSAPITGSNTELTDYIQKLKKNMSGGSIQITGGKSAGLSNRENKNSNQKSITSGVPAGRSVGIDLGTTFSAVSIVELGRPKIIPVDGARITPSVVGYLPTGEILVGEPARRQLVVNPQNSFASTKRVIGRSLEECETTGDNLVALRIDRTRSGEFCVLKCPILGRPLLPEEVSAEVLRKLLRAAQEYIGYDEPITKAVITVPAYFLPNQCTATEKAGKLAGLEKVKLLREPEAAALAYGLARKSPQIVLVFDLGGGTFDVSVLEVGGGLVEVIATSGDAHLGGDDFNAIIVNWIFEQLTAEHGLDRSNSLRGNVFAYSRISQAAEEAKIVLSSKAQVEIRLPYVMDGISIAYNLTRPKFESMSKGLLRRLLRPVREVAVMAGINLPGESGLMGVVDDEGDLYSSSEEEGIDAMFESENTTDVGGSSDKNSDLSAKDMRRLQTMGQRNARERNRLKGDTMKQVRALQRSTGDSSLGSFPGGQPLNEVLLVGGASRMPSVQRLVRVVTGVEPHKSVNPDEAVSLGAAVMAGILDGHISGMDVVSAWQAAVYRTLFEERNRLEEGDWRKDEVIKSSKGVVSVTTNVVSEKVVQTVKRKENLDPNTVRKSVPNLRRLSTVRRKKLNESK